MIIRSVWARILDVLRHPAPLPSTPPAVTPPVVSSGTFTTLILNGAAVRTRLEPDPRAGTVFRSIDEIGCTIDAGTSSMYETVTGRDVSEFDLVQVLSHPRPTGALLSTLADHLSHHGRPVTNMVGIGAPTRLLQMARLARSGVPVPRTVYLSVEHLRGVHEQMAAMLGAPYILTTLGTFRADREQLIDGSAALERVLAEADLGVMAQQFIPSQGIYRILVMGGRAVLAMGPSDLGDRGADEISRYPDQVLDLETFDPEARRLAARAAQAMGYDICAVLMVRHMLERTWHVIEAHFSPAIGSGPHPGFEIEAYTTYLERRPRAGGPGFRATSLPA